MINDRRKSSQPKHYSDTENQMTINFITFITGCMMGAFIAMVVMS